MSEEVQQKPITWQSVRDERRDWKNSKRRTDNVKFMMSVDRTVMENLDTFAKDRGITFQEFLRAEVFPFYLNHHKNEPEVQR